MLEHLDARLPSEYAGFGVSAHTAGPYQDATNASLGLDGRDLLAPCASLPPCRGTPRGRMRGVGATCTAPTTHGRPKRTSAPERCQIAAGRKQRRRLSVRAASLASPRPISPAPSPAAAALPREKFRSRPCRPVQVLGSAVGMCVRARACVFVLRYGLNLREVLFDVYTDARRICSSHLRP